MDPVPPRAKALILIQGQEFAFSRNSKRDSIAEKAGIDNDTFCFGSTGNNPSVKHSQSALMTPFTL
ncbi:MAG: hypothetical protein CL388_06960 [Acidiferrobacteraceae bacterium]|jgi:hypothetical protein|nr:hypothetical protein [Acidiferrobacteraceae bacterium]|tara:strand:- start:10555 stop:10752 length:198 start_codon:yes stop_codon:yes gene_type:complete